MQPITFGRTSQGAEHAELDTVPCWVREMSDEDVYMTLAVSNAAAQRHRHVELRPKGKPEGSPITDFVVEDR